MSNEPQNNTIVETRHALSLQPALRFPEFQDSGDWDERELGELCKFIRGPFGGALKKEIFVASGYAVYEQSHAIYNNFNSFRYYITEEKFNELKRFSVLPNDIIMSCSGTMGKFAIVPYGSKEGIINQALLKLTVKKEFNVEFIKATLELPENQNRLLSQSAGGAIKNVVEVAQIKEIKLCIPSLLEQRKIADCLSSLDALITAEGEKLQALKAHKKGLMQNLFPAEGETVPRLRFPEFQDSEEWEVEILSGKEIARFVNEKTTLGALRIETYVSTENLLPDYAGVTIASKLPPSGSFTKFKAGDILISNIRPYLKKVWLSDFDGAASNDVIVVRSGSKVSEAFLSFLLKNDTFIDFIMKGAKGTKMPRGDKSMMGNYLITFPSLPEQHKIADCLSSLDALMTAQGEKIALLKQHKKGLMQVLFP